MQRLALLKHVPGTDRGYDFLGFIDGTANVRTPAQIADFIFHRALRNKDRATWHLIKRAASMTTLDYQVFDRRYLRASRAFHARMNQLREMAYRSGAR